MIIPVIFSLAPVANELLYSWVFYKGIDMVKHYGWPLFAQHQYFEEKEKQRERGFYSETVAKHNDIEPYSPADDTKYIQVVFPETLIQEYISRFPSQTDAYIASIDTPWPEMTQFMVEKVLELEKNGIGSMEAFLCLCDTRFIRDAAQQLNTDILHYEWAPFRGPAYRNTAYLDLTGNICDGELSSRYETFRTVADELPIFTRREILAFFLNDENLHYAYEDDMEPEFEAGLGFGYNVPWIFNHLSQMSSVEMYTKAEKVFGPEHILVRYHPSDPIHADLRQGVRDSGSLIEFIRKSRRVICNTSGLAYEAMLFNRPAYELGQSQYKYYANTDLKELPDRIADDNFLSFVAFGYCIPFELLKSVSYLRWRLSRPSEQEIYMYHLNYYMNCLLIPQQALSLQGKERLEAFLKMRGAEVEIMEEDAPIWVKTDETSRLYAQVERYKRNLRSIESQKEKVKGIIQQKDQQIFEQEIRIRELNEDIANLRNSKSWRITKPLRRVSNWLRQEK